MELTFILPPDTGVSQALFYSGVGVRVLQMSKTFKKAIGLSVLAVQHTK